MLTAVRAVIDRTTLTAQEIQIMFAASQLLDSDVLPQFVEDTLCTGAVATAATTAVASLCGELEEHEPIAPLNAVSHIAWGDEAADHDEASLKYTLPGTLLNTAAITGWAGVHEFLFGGKRQSHTLTGALAAGAATSTLAYITDYYLVPRRFTPGFEKRLSNKSLAAVYGVLAVSLGLGSYSRSRRPASTTTRKSRS